MPQLFVDLDEPSPLVRAQVQDLAAGAHVGYCMTKALSAQNQPAPLTPDGESVAGGRQAS